MVETTNIEANIQDQKNIEEMFKKRMNRAITSVVILMTIMYIVVVLPLMYLDVTHITMHIVGFVAMILVFPILTFFAGMWLVWKKKFFPQEPEE